MEEIIAEKKESQKGINKFDFVGSVVHKYRPSPDIIVLTVAMKGKEIHEADYPNVAFYGKDMADAIDANVVVEKGNYPRMRISGIVQTDRKMQDGKVINYQNFVGTKIRKAESSMEALSGVRGLGRRKAESQNDICLLGEVVNVYRITRENRPRPLGVIVTLRVNTDHVNFPRVSCFGRMVPAAVALERGDVVCITGFAETQFREGHGRRMRMESIIATEIVKA